MSDRTLVIVESPNKARKLAAYLGAGYTVKASFGHVADLPPRDYGVDLATLEESYVVRNAKLVRELRELVKRGGFDRVLLASDPDREGEAIAWHLARELKLGARTSGRIELREITAAAIRAAVKAPREIDGPRVDAQRSRRVLDRIVGFDCSREICWPAGAKSAGRCQTPALHLLCEREREILAFVARTYWTLETTYAEGFTAFVPADVPADDAPREEGDARDGAASERGGRLVPKQFASEAEARVVRDEAARHPHLVRGVESRRTERRAPPPYITSTLQQDASRKLRLSAKQTMDAAQALFEAGLITYHRTDSTRVSDDAAQMARDHLARTHPEALPAEAPRARTKAGAQDAHEAIRPTALDGEDAPPAGAAAKLYAMIRARFLASQSKPARFDRTLVWIDSGPIAWVAEGSVLAEPGFLVFWGPYARAEDVVLPAVRAGQRLEPTDIAVHEKTTSPPSRYDQGALIKKLETSGIGRPATFASIIATLLERGYAHEIAAGRGKRVLQPTELGMSVDGLMSHAFPELVTERYTADMEAKLDEIEHGGETRERYLRSWYASFREAMARAERLGIAYRQLHGLRASSGGGASHEDTNIRCDRCGEAMYRKIQRRKAKGSFLACPACRMTRNVRAKVRAGACPRCGSALIEKKIGKRAAFWGCVRYGAATTPCAYTEPSREASAPAPRTPGDLADDTTAARSAGGETRSRAKRPPRARAARETREPTDKTCPKCGRHKLVILTPAASGRGAAPRAAFYACEDHVCNFSLPVGAKRRRLPCPVCGGVVLERRRVGSDALGAGEPFWSCARYPACDWSERWPSDAR